MTLSWYAIFRLKRQVCSLTNLLVMAGLSLADKEKTTHLSPERVDWVRSGCFIGIDDWSFPDQVNFTRIFYVRALDNLPTDEKKDCDNGHAIAAKERLSIERMECSVTVYAND
jgi:hypothetical protein